jgi:hypothetical protein
MDTPLPLPCVPHSHLLLRTALLLPLKHNQVQMKLEESLTAVYHGLWGLHVKGDGSYQWLGSTDCLNSIGTWNPDLVDTALAWSFLCLSIFPWLFTALGPGSGGPPDGRPRAALYCFFGIVDDFKTMSWVFYCALITPLRWHKYSFHSDVFAMPPLYCWVPNHDHILIRYFTNSLYLAGAL